MVISVTTPDYHTCRSYQKALGLEPPDRVLWRVLAGLLTPAQLQEVRRAHFRAQQRYQRASKLNQMARWLRAMERSNVSSPRNQAKVEKWRAILAEPGKYVEGGE